MRSFHYVTRFKDKPMVQLERGISGPAVTKAPGGGRRSVVLLRSSPWKAGTKETPWEDDLSGPIVRYKGDHKSTITGPLGSTSGNKLLSEIMPLFLSRNPSERMAAPPVLMLESVPGKDEQGVLREKGFVRFHGLLRPVSLTAVTDESGDGFRRVTFPNYLMSLEVVPLLDGSFDWGWVNDRRSEAIPLSECARQAPPAWRDWVSAV